MTVGESEVLAARRARLLAANCRGSLLDAERARGEMSRRDPAPVIVVAGMLALLLFAPAGAAGAEEVEFVCCGVGCHRAEPLMPEHECAEPAVRSGPVARGEKQPLPEHTNSLAGAEQVGRARVRVVRKGVKEDGREGVATKTEPRGLVFVTFDEGPPWRGWYEDHEVLVLRGIAAEETP